MPRADRKTTSELIAVVGDVHGHLQLALAVLAEWQEHLGARFAAVCLCGDVGTFVAEDQLDNATRRHARANPCELEFLHQWAVTPQPPWIDSIFRSRSAGGLGLECPVIMVHGNHEGFSHLARLVPSGYPGSPVPIADLPTVDSGAHLRLLPSGWVAEIAGRTIAAIGGIERGQRAADYHEMAYIDEEAVLHLLGRETPADLLITHQGPARIQGEVGSPTLDLLLERPVARVWCHGHSVRSPSICIEGGTQIVPLHDVAFAGVEGQEPGADGWALVQLAPAISASRETPFFLRSYRRQRWATSDEGALVAPPLAYLLEHHRARTASERRAPVVQQSGQDGVVPRVYSYVGTPELLEQYRNAEVRIPVRRAEDALLWVRGAGQGAERTATFIVDTQEQLWLADRHAEHVACARGGDVLCAGEMHLVLRGSQPEIAELTNQSTGYCPEPESWAVLTSVLTRIPLSHPPSWTHPFTFRRCDACGQRNIVKDDCFECDVCGAPLSRDWNFD